MRKILPGRRAIDDGVFQIKIETGNTYPGSSANNQFFLPITTPTSGGLVAFRVSWGDGTFDNFNASTASTAGHTYASSGQYIIKIKGALRGWSFGQYSGFSDEGKVLEIMNWGCFRFTNVRAFEGCNAMEFITCKDTPIFEHNMVGPSFQRNDLFNNCGKLEYILNIKDWDVSKIESMRAMFQNCAKLGQTGGQADLSNWDVSRVTDFSFMFSGCALFNGLMFDSVSNKCTNLRVMFQNADDFDAGGSDTEMSKWDTSKVTNMMSMFYRAHTFNRNISAWDTSRVVNMENMFFASPGSGLFNQPIGQWDTSSVTTIESIFTGQNSFDQDLSNWNLNSLNSHSNAQPPLSQPLGGFQLSTANYDALLVAWDAYSYPSLPSGSTWNFRNSTYSLGSAAATARASLVTKWGGIIDGGGV